MGGSIQIGKSSPKEIRPCHSKLYRGGYVDISPFPCDPDFDRSRSLQPGPSRESIFDDILFYWHNASRFPNLHSYILKDAVSFVEGTSFFLNRVIASNWMQFIVYFDEVIDRLEYALARADIKVLDGVENHLTDVEFWHRRCRKSCEHLERTTYALQSDFNVNRGTSFVNSQTSSGSAIYKCTDDFLYIYNQTSALRERCQYLNQSLTYVISIVQYKRSSDEATSLRILTVLGMLFVPLTFASGLFSMSDEFKPGAKHFWVYFVISLPMVGVVFTAVFAKEVAETLRIKQKETKSLLQVRFSARPGNQEHELMDVEKGKA